MNLTASSYLQALDRLDIEERVEYLARCLAGPLEEGVRPVLAREYLSITDRENTPTNTQKLTARENEHEHL